jgi:hypothetical protein
VKEFSCEGIFTPAAVLAAELSSFARPFGFAQRQLAEGDGPHTIQVRLRV